MRKDLEDEQKARKKLEAMIKSLKNASVPKIEQEVS